MVNESITSVERQTQLTDGGYFEEEGKELSVYQWGREIHPMG